MFKIYLNDKTSDYLFDKSNTKKEINCQITDN